MFCWNCSSKLAKLEKKIDDLHETIQTLTNHLVSDPAQLAELTNRLNEKNTLIRAAIDANLIPGK